MRTVQLREVSSVISKGSTPTSNGLSYSKLGIPFLRAEDVNGGPVNLADVTCRISAAVHAALKRSQLQPGDLLVTIAGTLGRIGLVPPTNEPVNCNQAVAFARLKPSLVDLRYACYACQSSAVLRSLLNQQKVGTIGNLNLEQLGNLRLPLPALTIQQRIAARLDQADRIRRIRRYALELSDSFLPAAFREMFGDPASNPNNWQRCYLGDVIRTAQDGPHVSPPYCEDGIPFVSTRNVRPGRFVWQDMKYISVADATEQWRKVKPERGDILYTKGGTTGLAKVIDFDKEIAVWVHIAVLKLRKELVEPVWLENMLNSRFCYQQSQELTFGIANRDLGLKRMPRIQIYLPPMKLQKNFAHLVERYAKLQARHEEALRQAEHLFRSLLHQAFSPQLD